MTLPLHSLSGLRAAYLAGATTPEAVIAEVYERLAVAATIDPAIWINVREPAAVMAEAAALTGKTIADLPLYGIPFAVKDNIDVAGVPTTAACAEFAYTPEASAVVVQRLQAAGALVIGKTNLDQFATGLVGVRSPWGAPRNAFDTRYVSGGSSSGSAVAVSRGLVTFSLGTDTAGSGRVPAMMNNIVGLKPSKGLLSTTGVVPACRSLDCVSIFATTADDAAAVLAVAAGYDAGDAYSRTSPVPISPLLPRTPSHISIGVPRRDQLVFCGDAAAEALFHAAVARAEGLGGTIVELDFEPFYETARLLYEGAWVAERTAAVGAFLDANPEVGDPTVRKIIEGGNRLSAVDAFKGLYRLEALRGVCAGVWGAVDVLLVPTAPTAYTVADVLADPIRLNANLGTYTNFVNFLDLAAVAVPSGFTPTGLPHGVTLIAPAHADLALLSLGDALHRTVETPKAGATAEALAAVGPRQGAWTTATPRVAVAVVGAHLQGLPLNYQLTSVGGRLIKKTQTAPLYKLYALTAAMPPRPGMVRVAEGGAAIEVEVWDMPTTAFAAFVAQIAAPLGIGWVTLADGSSVLGFLAEAAGVAGTPDITALGGWRAYLAR